MLYWLLVPLKDHWIFFNVFRYITVRTVLAGITALLISMIAGPLLIKYLRKRQIGAEIRIEGPKTHYTKKGTPSMGGILIIGATIITTLIWGDLGNEYVWLAIITMLSFGLVGFWDDYIQSKKKIKQGLVARHKIIFQTILATVIGLILIYLGSRGEFNLHLSVPFFKNWTPYFGAFYLPWIMFILVGSSNSVN
ncbi:MAG: phospho-N-acetylmuramoyl-pentapeptide-transferase, partial [Candidatus Aminicenantes bacterium]|nr:phospho-N-acetylmuramoyl-pentapeptide-transferase [Candidatus Aminicenantes bacterium]